MPGLSPHLAGLRNEGIVTATVRFAQKYSRPIGALLAGTALSIIAFPTGTSVQDMPAEAIFRLGIYGPVIGAIFLVTCIVFNHYNITRAQHAATVSRLADRWRLFQDPANEWICGTLTGTD